MNPNQNTQNTNTQSPQILGSLDPQVTNLTKSIRAVETQGQSDPFTAKGKSGEYGAYQFTPDTWNSLSSKYGVNAPLEKSTPIQQNEVAYKQIKEWKDQGMNVGQIASMWNSGKPDAYLDPNFQGKNKYGANYDVPAYAKSVATAYQALKAGQPTTGITSPSTVGDQNPPQEKGFFGNLMSGDILKAGKQLTDFAFPIIHDAVNVIQGDNQKSILQILGDAGLSALWFVPGFGEATGVLANIGKGAALGYGADVASKLSEGKTDIGGILTPGLGTVTGGVAGGILGKLSSSLGRNITQKGATNALQENLSKAIGATKSGSKFLQTSSERGLNPAELIAKSGSIPDIMDGRFVTGDAQALLNKRIGQLGEVRANALDLVGKNTSLERGRAEVLTKVEGLKASGETGKITNQINKIFDDFETNYGKNLSASELEKIKEAQAGASGIYKRTGQIGEQNASSLIGDWARNKVESMASESGFPGMDEFNKYIQSHYNAIDALDKINGQVVKGGRLGNLMRGHTIAGVGALGANAMGGGFLGILATAGGGEAVNSILSKILGDTSFTNPLRDLVLNKIAQENPEIVQQLQKFMMNKAVGSGDVAKITKALNTGGKVAPLLTPKVPKMAGLVPRTLTTATARGGASLTQ